MSTLPTKPDLAEPTEVQVLPTWHDLGNRFRDVMKDIGIEIGHTLKKEGKELERELQVRLLPALKRARLKIEKLISRLEERVAKKQP